MSDDDDAADDDEAADDDDATDDDDAACEEPPAEYLDDTLLPRCSQDTYECVLNCPANNYTCADECVAQDTSPADADYGIDCAGCTFYQYLACLQENGCSEVAEAYTCCEAECNYDETCIDTECSAEVSALYSCGPSDAWACVEAYYSADDGCYPVQR